MGNVKLVPEQLIVGGRYRLEEKLGQGGFGVVWKCWDTLECRHVAMKTLLPSIAENEGSVPRFRREIIAAARLSHPNIVQILEAGQLDDGRPFFMMEFLFGEGVEGYADDFGALLDLFCQLLAALAYAHARGVIHRDLKPDNVIVTSESDGGLTLKLLDFGVAMVAEGFGGEARQVSLTNPGLPVGTISYMSPEQASGEASSVGPASDLYSIGVMLYQLLSGKLPFVGDWMYVIVQHVGHAAKPLELRPE